MVVLQGLSFQLLPIASSFDTVVPSVFIILIVVYRVIVPVLVVIIGVVALSGVCPLLLILEVLVTLAALIVLIPVVTHNLVMTSIVINLFFRFHSTRLRLIII